MGSVFVGLTGLTCISPNACFLYGTVAIIPQPDDNGPVSIGGFVLKWNGKAFRPFYFEMERVVYDNIVCRTETECLMTEYSLDESDRRKMSALRFR